MVLRRAVRLVVLAAAVVTAQPYVLESRVIDGGGGRAAAPGHACGSSAGQAVASGWTTSPGYRAILGFWNRPFRIVGIDEGDRESAALTGFTLAGCVPNPVRSRAVVSYSLPRAMSVNLSVYGPDGRLVETLVSDVRPAGAGCVTWDADLGPGSRLPDGVYFLSLESGRQRAVGKVVVLR